MVNETDTRGRGNHIDKKVEKKPKRSGTPPKPLTDTAKKVNDILKK